MARRSTDAQECLKHEITRDWRCTVSILHRQESDLTSTLMTSTLLLYRSCARNRHSWQQIGSALEFMKVLGKAQSNNGDHQHKDPDCHDPQRLASPFAKRHVPDARGQNHGGH